MHLWSPEQLASRLAVTADVRELLWALTHFGHDDHSFGLGAVLPDSSWIKNAGDCHSLRLLVVNA